MFLSRNVEEAKIAKRKWCRLLGNRSNVFYSNKNDAKAVLFETLRQITESKFTLCTYWRNNTDNVDKLKQFNPDGYALVSGILAADDIGKG